MQESRFRLTLGTYSQNYWPSRTASRSDVLSVYSPSWEAWQYGRVVEFADDTEMAERAALAAEFFTAIRLDEEFQPFFVSDEAALYDIQMEDDEFVIRCVAQHYGVAITSPDDFRRPFWQLLDDLHGQRR